MKVTIYKVSPMAEISEIAIYRNNPFEALVSYVIVYVLKQGGNLLNEETRNKVRAEIKTGRASYMYFAPSNYTYYVKK